MEIIGNDNRIRALFSESKTTDGQAAPSFSSIWRRAEARSLQAHRSFSFSLAAVTAMLALTLGSLAVWSAYQNRSNAHYKVFAELKATNKRVTPEIDVAAPVIDQKPLPRPIRSRTNRSVMRNESLVAKNKDTKATTIDTWQSPTEALLTSPADGLFKSLPQLNENANEMKSFLPGRANEKEK